MAGNQGQKCPNDKFLYSLCILSTLVYPGTHTIATYPLELTQLIVSLLTDSACFDLMRVIRQD